MGILRDGSDRKPLRIEDAIELGGQITYAESVSADLAPLIGLA